MPPIDDRPASGDPTARYARVRVIGLDCDDTLWQSENHFQDIHDRYRELLAPHADLDDAALDATMLATERANLGLFGYGVKGFVLSLIETAIEVTDRQIPAEAIATMIAWGKELLSHPVDLLDGVADTTAALAARGYRLVLITKGDLWHQESKVATSGLAELADGVAIVSEKDPATYRRVLADHDVDPTTFCMVGNSVRSDVLPVLDIGGHAIHIPYVVTWAHEHVDDPGAAFETLGTFADLLDVLAGPQSR